MTNIELIHSEIKSSMNHLAYAAKYLKDSEMYSDEERKSIAKDIRVCMEALTLISTDVNSEVISIDNAIDKIISIMCYLIGVKKVKVVESSNSNNMALSHHIEMTIYILYYWAFEKYRIFKV